jgi:hypothetical protein
MKCAVLLLVLALATPAAAQGPIARSVTRQAEELTTKRYRKEMREPVLFWTGVALVGAGALTGIAALTWERESDLELEHLNTRLGRDLAPCGTSPQRTTLPIADCKIHEGLLWFGASMLVGGGILMLVGGQEVQVVEVGPASAALRVRF